MPLIYYLSLKKTHFAIKLQPHYLLLWHWASPWIHASLLSLLNFLPTVLPAHSKLQGAFFVILSLPLRSEVSLFSTAHCQAYLTCSRLSSLPALPVPYRLLMGRYWNKEECLGLLTKQLLWKENKECCGFSCSSSDFISNAILWQLSQ